jgi:hypothetical protein
MTVVAQAVERGGDGRAVAKQFSPVFDRAAIYQQLGGCL